MPIYKAPLDEMRFVLHEVLDVGQLAKLPGYEEATPDIFDAMMDEVAKLCEDVLQPLNRSGDEEGCHFENGTVRTPAGFKEAYQTFTGLGLTGLICDPEYGGQGMPHTLLNVIDEMICSANLSFGMYPGLSMGAYSAIETHANDELKSTYLPKLVEGVWSGTMCLTEPHCGTDLGLIRTKAIPNGDGSFAISGTKIFISAGEHDLTENILHLVLAKLPDAPPGVKGISLFLVPKFLPRQDGGTVKPGAFNNVSCGSIEHKMGIKASATCVINLDGAQGWLVGEPHKGLKAMFTMMNAARLAVGLQGLGIAEVAYQNGLAYAKDRIQGRALTGTKAPEKAADPIIVHPDVRRNLLVAKSQNEAARTLAYWVGINLDISHKHADPAVRAEADDLVALMTPIVKSYLTDLGYDVATRSQQVLGGHGYIREWGLEQFVRDARITQIYEGTNGIQALDLVGRKMPKDFGRLLRRFFHPAQAFIDANMNDPQMAEFVLPFMKAFGKLQATTGLHAQKGMGNPDEAGAGATEYLRMFGLVALGYMWLKMVKVAQTKLAEGANGKTAFYDAKLKTARFYTQKLLPEVNTLATTIAAGAGTLMALDDAQF